MEENNIVMNDEVNEVPVEETDVDSVCSGNSFNKGLAALAVGAGVGLVFLGRTVVKKIKAKKATNAEDGEAPVEEEPKPKKKGLKIGKNKEIIIIDKRDQKKNDPAEDEVEE